MGVCDDLGIQVWVAGQAETSSAVGIKGIVFIFLNFEPRGIAVLAADILSDVAVKLGIGGSRAALHTDSPINIRRVSKIDPFVSGSINSTKLAIGVGRKIRLDIVI